MLNPSKCPSNSEDLVGVDLEIAVFDVESDGRSSGPLASIFRSVDASLNPTELLFVLYTSQVAHHTGNKLAHRSVDEVIVGANFQSDFLILNTGFMTETEFQELADIASPESGESGTTLGRLRPLHRQPRV